MHGVPHAEDRANIGRQHGQRAHVPIYFSAPDGTIQNSESLHHLPHRQIESMGAGSTQELANNFALARRAINQEAGADSTRVAAFPSPL